MNLVCVAASGSMQKAGAGLCRGRPGKGFNAQLAALDLSADLEPALRRQPCKVAEAAHHITAACRARSAEVIDNPAAANNRWCKLVMAMPSAAAARRLCARHEHQVVFVNGAISSPL